MTEKQRRHNRQFGKMAELVLKSTVVLRLNFSAKLNICASIAPPSPSAGTLWQKSAPLFFFNLSAKRIFCSLIQSSFFSKKQKTSQNLRGLLFINLSKLSVFHRNIVTFWSTLIHLSRSTNWVTVKTHFFPLRNPSW